MLEKEYKSMIVSVRIDFTFSGNDLIPLVIIIGARKYNDGLKDRLTNTQKEIKTDTDKSRKIDRIRDFLL
jgi:hypothetical protein